MQRHVERGDGSHRADDGGRTGHVGLHPLHTRLGLETVAPCVEGHALADQDDRVQLVGAVCIVLEDDEPRRGVTSLSHAQQRAHIQGLHLLPAQRIHPQLHLSGHLHGDLGQVGGSADVGRQVDQVTRQRDASGNDLPGIYPPLHRGHVPLAEDHQLKQPGQRFWCLLGLLAPVLVQPQQATLGRSLSRLLGRQPPRSCPVEDARHARRLEIARLLDGLGRRAADRVRWISVKLSPRAQANDNHAAGRDRTARVQHGHLPGLAGEIAAVDQVPNRAA